MPFFHHSQLYAFGNRYAHGRQNSAVESIAYGDFAKLDMRAARVVKAEPIRGRNRILKGRIDLGGGSEADVIIGGAQYFEPAEMVGRMVVAVVNLEPKRIAGIESCAMLLAADVDGRPFWLTAGDRVPPGSRIM